MSLSDYSKDELINELDRRYKEEQKKELEKLKQSIGFDVKKLACRYAPSDFRNDRSDFTFYLVHDGIYNDIYYDKNDWPKDGAIKPFWPLYLDDCALHLYIPEGFSEECENVYSFAGTLEEALAALKCAGLVDVHPATNEEYDRWAGKSDLADGGNES